MRNKLTITLYAIIIFGIFALGWLGNDVYMALSSKSQFEGLFLNQNFMPYLNYSHQEALETAGDYDKFGDWVCVNVLGMDYKRAVEVCSHEAGHEIFAEQCEKNITKCMGVIK